MRSTRFAALFACLVWPAIAAAESPFKSDLPHISWDKTAEHYGQECVVYGTVIAARNIGARCFLNFHENFRENFTVVINSDDYGKFPSPPESLYNGKHVRVVGKVVEYRNKPEIVVTSPEAIEIIESPIPPAVPAGVGAAPSGQTPVADATPSKPVAPAPPSPAKDGVVKVATFNLLNLFDDFDDPYVENEPVPGKKAEEKARLAAVLRGMAADIVALQEVESRPVVQRFVDEYLADFKYEVVLYEGNSDRGIDVALLSRLPVGPVTSHRHLDLTDSGGQPMRFQRDLLQVRITPEGFLPFDVFVVHLKSKHGGEEASLPIRAGEAKAIRSLFDDLLHADSQARFLICGDFNDTIESQPLQTIIGAGPVALRGFYDDLPSEKRITYNRQHLSMIDFVFASPALAAGYVPKSYDVLLGSVDAHGSDHNPVTASFKLTARTAEH